MTDMNAQIKPCPFCGSPAVFEYKEWNEHDQTGDDGTGRVDCTKCSASIEGCFDNAVSRWNVRAPYCPDGAGLAVVPVVPTDAMLAAAVYRTEDAGDEGALLNWQGMIAAAPRHVFVIPDALIDEMWERSGHGTEREDIVRAFEEGARSVMQIS